MPIRFDGTEVDAVTMDGSSLDNLVIDGTEVFQKVQPVTYAYGRFSPKYYTGYIFETPVDLYTTELNQSLFFVFWSVNYPGFNVFDENGDYDGNERSSEYSMINASVTPYVGGGISTVRTSQKVDGYMPGPKEILHSRLSNVGSISTYEGLYKATYALQLTVEPGDLVVSSVFSQSDYSKAADLNVSGGAYNKTNLYSVDQWVSSGGTETSSERVSGSYDVVTVSTTQTLEFSNHINNGNGFIAHAKPITD